MIFYCYQVWNQARPPWLNALLSPLRGMIVPIVATLLDAVKVRGSYGDDCMNSGVESRVECNIRLYFLFQTGASIYQAMSLTLACLTELYVCAPLGVLRAGLAMNDNLPAHCHPIGGSVILQLFCASLYSALLEVSVSGDAVEAQSEPRRSPTDAASEPSSFDPRNRFASATALAEALCSIDEDNKHTDQIESLLTLVEDW